MANTFSFNVIHLPDRTTKYEGAISSQLKLTVDTELAKFFSQHITFTRFAMSLSEVLWEPDFHVSHWKHSGTEPV
jgi:hypothetical protein